MIYVQFGSQNAHTHRIWTSYKGTADAGMMQRKGQSWGPLLEHTLHSTTQARWKVCEHQRLSRSSEARSGIWQMTHMGPSCTGPCAFAAALAAAVGSTEPSSARTGRGGGGSFGTATASGKLTGMPRGITT